MHKRSVISKFKFTLVVPVICFVAVGALSALCADKSDILDQAVKIRDEQRKNGQKVNRPERPTRDGKSLVSDFKLQKEKFFAERKELQDAAKEQRDKVRDEVTSKPVVAANARREVKEQVEAAREQAREHARKLAEEAKQAAERERRRE